MRVDVSYGRLPERGGHWIDDLGRALLHAVEHRQRGRELARLVQADLKRPSLIAETR